MDHTGGKQDKMPQPAVRDQLATRIIGVSVAALVITLGMIFGTLWLSWQLEGAAAAINDTGSLRMRATRLGLNLVQAPKQDEARQRVQDEINQIDTIIAGLYQGNPIRPLFLPTAEPVQAQMETVNRLWRSSLKPAAQQGLSRDAQAYLALLPDFIKQADRLVGLIETDNARKTTLLRMSQGVLIVIACVGTLAMVYLLYLWIIVPLLELQKGLQRMAGRDFDTRLPVESRDEFGVVAHGFNRMADELKSLYTSLETRVQDKTAQLAAQNRELGALYDMVAFLNQPSDIEEMCQGFLRRVMRQFEADGGSIRVIDPDGEKLHLLVSEGLSAELEEHEHCMKVDACFCGAAMQQGVVVIHDFSKVPIPAGQTRNCAHEGFTGIAVFRVMAQDTVLGSFSLHFADKRRLPQKEVHLLETLGQNLGVALENRRLGAQARQLAVAAERNLVAQGLHDSLAQGLNYLNLQVQMLDDALRRNAVGEIGEIVPRLQTGVNESYQDVRELLLNFRSKLEAGELKKAVSDTLNRFERQAGVTVVLDMEEVEGAPLPPEQQLQVLFILQEALSNIRKHAHAGKVGVRISNRRDFALDIDDDGRGFDAAEVETRSEKQHIGLNIMRERAARMHAQLTIDSRPGAGTHIRLLLPRDERQAA
ncbi:MAG TPA: type IV pili methyl-accepting chemotaxis transducer N-terminal domain-containing protein [Rhodocyclaceae bacterium]|nr:type IV pili methyl-accepting chemotaxis transducer N-terminal domain-containing protein [Rhodocyclaceae bacterium]